ncbi:MAG: anti-sigma factor family protein [Candidatus Zixiibacteriota bacterium]
MDKHLREMLAGYVDGELSDEERRAFEKILATDPELRRELEEFKKLKEVTGRMTYADLPPEVWENYWHSLYRKLERGFGWIFMSIGAIILLCFGAFGALYGLYTDPGISLWVKVGLGALIIGAITLMVSLIRERLFAYNRERYREVNR